MANNEFYSRIIHKHDIEANWIKAATNSNFIPKQGEIIVYDRDENYNYERIKIGDGITNVTNLPFSSSSGVTVELDESVNGVISTTNADLLGGLPANKYATKEDLESIDVDGGDITVNLDGAEQSGQPSTVNADLLGGQLPSYYDNRPVLLWTNENSKSSFAGQTINLDLSGYTTIKIYYRYGIDDVYLNIKESREIFVGDNTILWSITAVESGTANTYIGTRYVTTSQTGVIFSSAGLRQINSTTVTEVTSTDRYCIPQYIFGIK